MSADTIDLARPTAFSLTVLVSEMRRDEPRLFAFGVLMLAAMPVTAFAGLADQRLFLGIDVWQKPLKFELALAVFSLTLAFFARFLPAATREKGWYRVYSAAVVAMMGSEMIWIGGAAMLGTASHFNQTPFGGAIYSVMGVFAAGFTAVTAVYAWQIRRNRELALPPVLKEAMVVGLALVLPLTLATAGTMAQLGGHRVGGAASDVGGLALMGWARAGGDLRVAHFFATHAMHFLPAAGLASAFALGPNRKATVRLFAVAYTGLVVFAFIQALAGRPFLPWL